jgi:phospholipid/cholesterol/gamma-HCH transport system substrate-binding protein
MTRTAHLPLKAAGVVTFLLAAAGVFLYFLSLSGVQLFPGSTYGIHAIVPSAVSLAQDADVVEAGVKVGRVQSIGTQGANAALDLALDPRYTPVYRNAQVLIRDKTIAGESYVDLEPGTPTAGTVPNGGTLPAPQPESTQIDQILSTLDRAHRRDLQHILDSLGQGVGGHGNDLNRFLDGSASLVQQTLPVNQVLAADRQQTAQLIDDFGQVMSALGEKRQEIAVLVHQERAIAQAVAARDTQLRQTIDAFPGFLRQAHTTIADLGTFSAAATPVMGDMAIAMQDLVPAFRELQPATDATRSTMNALSRFNTAATPMLGDLRAFAGATQTLPAPLQAVLRQVNPLEAYLVPYATQMSNVFSQMRAASNLTDATGHYLRAQALLTLSGAVGVFTPAQEQAYRALLAGGVLGQFTDTRGINPYPKPGGAEHLQPFSGTYPRLQPDPPYVKAGR